MSAITTPYDHATTAGEVVAGIDLSGRRVIVTGAASGIGVETARALALTGAQVTLAVRDVAAGKRVAQDIVTTIGSDGVDVAHLDLADLASVDAFTAAWDGPLHVLVNNAGVMATPEGATAQGWELQFGTNHMGHFALALGLRVVAPAVALWGPSVVARAVALARASHAPRARPGGEKRGDPARRQPLHATVGATAGAIPAPTTAALTCGFAGPAHPSTAASTAIVLWAPVARPLGRLQRPAATATHSCTTGGEALHESRLAVERASVRHCSCPFRAAPRRFESRRTSPGRPAFSRLTSANRSAFAPACWWP